MDSLERAYRVLGLEDAADGDEVFRHLVLARIIEPSSKLDSLRVLDEAGVTRASYRTLKRRLPAYAERQWLPNSGPGKDLCRPAVLAPRLTTRAKWVRLPRREEVSRHPADTAEDRRPSSGKDAIAGGSSRAQGPSGTRSVRHGAAVKASWVRPHYWV